MENIGNIIELNNQDNAVVSGGMKKSGTFEFNQADGLFYYISAQKKCCIKAFRVICTTSVLFLGLSVASALGVVAIVVGAAYYKGYFSSSKDLRDKVIKVD